VKTPSLTEHERRIAKKLLADGETYQDVQQIINTGRSPTINPGRFAGWKTWEIEEASDDELSRFRYEKSLVDLKTGLSPIENERLFRSREAMICAVDLFNSSTLIFKFDAYPVLSQIAWTYLLHEYYDRIGVDIYLQDGNSLLLSQMLKRQDCPLEDDVRKNLEAVKVLRDSVEHKLLGSIARTYWPLFQANCLNYDRAIRKLFGDEAGLQTSLSVALQFGQMSINQLSNLQKYDITESIEAIDAAIAEQVGVTGNEGLSYQFKVSYHFEKATKGDSHIVFNQNNPNGSTTKNILTQKVVGDELWPHKPDAVVKSVAKKTGQNFNHHHHQLAWKKYGARPRSGSKNPGDCKKHFCHFHVAHKDYTYSDKWIEFLVNIVSDEDEFEKLKAFTPT
jgi:hypothetical protein